MSTEENKAFMRRYCEEVFNQGLPDPNREGRAMHRSDHGITFTGLPSQGYRVTIEDQVAEGDKVVSRWRLEGPASGEWKTPWGTFAANNTPMTYTWISIDRFENGRVVEAWVEGDFLGIAMQVGAIPSAK